MRPEKSNLVHEKKHKLKHPDPLNDIWAKQKLQLMQDESLMIPAWNHRKIAEYSIKNKYNHTNNQKV